MADRADDPVANARREALRRVYDLPYEDQAEVHRLLGSFITAGEPEENPIDRQVADRLASLEALKAAAKWLGLPEDTAPTVKQYEQARAALDLEFSSGQIVRRWERWRTAGHALTGRGFVAVTAAQRRLRGVGAGRQREYEDYITAVREWRDCRPDPPRSRRSYNEWSRSMTAERERVGERPLPDAAHITSQFALSWPYVEKVATRELDLYEARRLYLEGLHANAGPMNLLPLHGVAITLGISGPAAHQMKSQAEFPLWVAHVGDGHCWYREDIEAFRDGEDIPERKQGEAHRFIYTVRDLAELRGITPRKATQHASKRRWNLIPEPAGRPGHYVYWMRRDVQRWMRNWRRQQSLA